MMAGEAFSDEAHRLLSPDAFEFVLINELKRAVRSQSFLTLVHVEPTIRGQAGGDHIERDGMVSEIGRLISRDVRETDLLANSGGGRLSVVLLDADLESSLGVIERLRSRLDHYQFRHPLSIEVRAACCPTHGADADSLRRAAEARPDHPRRHEPPNASKAQ